MRKQDLVGAFAQHRVAANLLMIMMILSGFWALSQLNTQFFPNFALDILSVRVPWTGASAEDVERSITVPIEQELRTLDGLKEMTSTSAEGVASITLEYEEGTDMGVALDQVKEQVALIRNLPATAEEPEISRIIRYEPVAKVLVTGPSDRRELRPLAHQLERELLARGIAKITVSGLPEEEVAIQVPVARLRELDLSLDAIADRVASFSRDLPAGTIGRDDVARQLRALEQRRRTVEFERLPLQADESGRLLTLGDIATIERRPRTRQTYISVRGRPAVELALQRAEQGDSLAAARILDEWIDDARQRMPAGVELHTFDESWQLIRERILLLLKNGVGGLVLVVAILFLFLNGRVAWWVAVGIPVSFAAALFALYLFGGSINMISLFAFIMTLGIIVDDAIVVGEDALAHYQTGEAPLLAAEGGARRMLAPVMASSLTTMAAFLPLMLVSGIIGNILFDIPLVVICVILASLIESFLVLPGHLQHSFRALHRGSVRRGRERLDRAFARFRDGMFRRFVGLAVANPWLTLSSAVALLVLCVGLLVGGRITFNFFPSIESTILRATVGFVSGTPPARVQAFMDHLHETLQATDRALGGDLVAVAVTRLGHIPAERGSGKRGDQFGTMTVELIKPDARKVRNSEFIHAWQERVVFPAGIESFAVLERRPGPPGRDVEIQLTGWDPTQLKGAAVELVDTLKSLPGVTSAEDDTPFGPEQLIYRLTPEGKVTGLTVDSVGRQLRAAYDGHIAQIFQDGEDEVEVRVVLPDRERHSLASLEGLGIMLPNGNDMPVSNAVEFTTRRGFETLRHAEGKLAIEVVADVDPAVTTSDEVRARLEAELLPELRNRYQLDYSFEGRAAEQAETLGDMRRGMIYAGAMIYLVLAWVFASYGWPLVVMSVIPFGLVGAVVGHWLMGIDLTILSLFGLFGLSGIVVNDSIILAIFFRHLRGSGMAIREAIIEAACQRLRAVLLTSLTTIAGLTPLLFETSLQAQFLIPMAVSISFGLAFATLLVLVLVPTLLSLYERGLARVAAARRNAAVS
jgi:multidrug efflux pump subunit AcrB